MPVFRYEKDKGIGKIFLYSVLHFNLKLYTILYLIITTTKWLQLINSLIDSSD